MSRLEQFILTSDFATLKNDGNSSINVTVPASISIATNTVYTMSADLTVGSQLGEARVRIQSSKQGARYYLGQFGANRTGTVGGVNTPYTIYAIVSRINTTQIRCLCMVPNTNAGTLTGGGTPETFTFVINTFIPPVV